MTSEGQNDDSRWRVVISRQTDLYGWLGGPEAKGPRYTDEYLASSALGMLFL